MRLAWLRARCFVHATEDEDRVRTALLWSIAQADEPKARAKVHRSAAKGHYGQDIVVLEATLKREAEVEEALGRLRADPDVRAQIEDTLLRRLDEDDVLHVRLDKQAAVTGQTRLNEGSDAIVVRVKGLRPRDVTPARAWKQALGGAES